MHKQMVVFKKEGRVFGEPYRKDLIMLGSVSGPQFVESRHSCKETDVFAGTST